MSNLRGRSVSGELSSKLETSGSSCEDSKLHCRETRAVTVRTPMLAGGNLQMSADAAGMFLLCVYPLAGLKGVSTEPGNGWEEVELALANGEPAYFQERELPRLTPTETEVMDRLAQGKSNRVIAEEMFISINTVKTHVRSIFQKLGVNTRASAVRLATAAGLLDHWLPPPSP
ncbi:MAG: response regulator transcription factor [Firmicutes bacterium]|jgi:DNA-binding CsgD family transcriptional regulator|nr:response regulator transcription factor [Bacillota bacterium]MDD4792886.1 response regulator transcription factor [Bacillota bacterium]